MKLIIVICTLVAVAIAAPPKRGPAPARGPPPPAPPPPSPAQYSAPTNEGVQIVRSELKQEADGSYKSVVETNDGYHREESGQLEEVLNEEGKPVRVLIIRGSYGYRDPDGNPQDISYVADQDGFHAEGPSIPKVPEPSRR